MLPHTSAQHFEEAQALCLALLRENNIQILCTDALKDRVNPRYLHLETEMHLNNATDRQNLPTPIPTSPRPGRRLQEILVDNPYIIPKKTFRNEAGKLQVCFSVAPEEILHDFLEEDAEFEMASVPDLFLPSLDKNYLVEQTEHHTAEIFLGCVIQNVAHYLLKKGFDIANPHNITNLQSSTTQELSPKLEGKSDLSNTSFVAEFQQTLNNSTPVNNTPIPEQYRCILKCLLDKLDSKDRYGDLLHSIGRVKIENDLHNAINTRLLNIYGSNSFFTLTELDDLRRDEELVTYDKPGCYIHVLAHSNMPGKPQFYVGASFNVIKRVLQHIQARQWRRSLHYFCWNQPDVRDFWLLLGGFEDATRHEYEPHQFNLLLNIFEMWNGLIFRVFSKKLLSKWLPRSITIPDHQFGNHLNVASPLIQTYRDATTDWLHSNNKKVLATYDDLPHSPHPLVAAYARYIRDRRGPPVTSTSGNMGYSAYQVHQTTIGRRKMLPEERTQHFRDADPALGDQQKVLTICVSCLKQGMISQYEDINPIYTTLGGIYIARARNCGKCDTNKVKKPHKLHIPIDLNQLFIKLDDVPGPTKSERLRARRQSSLKYLTQMHQKDDWGFESYENTAVQGTTCT